MPKTKDERLSLMAGRVRSLVDEIGSIAAAARKAGIHPNTVSRMCAGEHEPGVFAAATFAASAGVPLAWLLGMSDERLVTPPETAETAAPAAVVRPTASGPPPLDETQLAELFRSALVIYGSLDPAAAMEVAKALIQRARSPRADPEDPPEEAPPPDRPGADLSEYRCAVPDGVRIDFKTLEPDSARAGIERNCDTLGKVLTAPCRTRVRFVYEGFDQAPTTSGGAVAIVIAEDGKGTVVGR